MASYTSRGRRRALLNSESASISVLWILLAVISAIAIGGALYGISYDDGAVGASAVAATGTLPHQ